MCLAFARRYYETQIALYDNFGILENSLGNNFLKNCFKVTLNKENNVRFIRPDLVLKDPSFIIEDDFLEKIYHVVKKQDSIDISYNKTIDIKSFSEIDKLRKDEFKEKPRIKAFLQSTGHYPPVFTITLQEYETFKQKAKTRLQKKGFFEIASRYPKVVQTLSNSYQNKSYLVVDFKYMSEEAFGEKLDYQIQKTVKKQIVYELALKLNLDAITHSEFWIPSFIVNRFENVPKIVKRFSMNCQPFSQEHKISVMQLDFLTLQQIYIQDAL